ncbi:hypothetical protein niasHS_016545 [Heterodera schachtii]|uniref:Remorin C-terminal domain-containing protein n=1 Tax=Heterodera schachtii TaxID=97005 RepID=A0ABD2HUN7_HETSC
MSEQQHAGSSNTAKCGRKRDLAAVRHAFEMNKIKEEKRKLRMRRMEEVVQRERALIKIRHEYRKAKSAVLSGQFRFSCSASSMVITIPQMAKTNGQAAESFTIVIAYGPAEQGGPNAASSHVQPAAQKTVRQDSRPTDPRIARGVSCANSAAGCGPVTGNARDG